MFEVTGCGELSERVDLATQARGCGAVACSCSCAARLQVYTKGSHLLCHDDVIGTRKVQGRVKGLNALPRVDPKMLVKPTVTGAAQLGLVDSTHPCAVDSWILARSPALAAPLPETLAPCRPSAGFAMLAFVPAVTVPRLGNISPQIYPEREGGRESGRLPTSAESSLF